MVRVFFALGLQPTKNADKTLPDNTVLSCLLNHCFHSPINISTFTDKK